MFRVSIALLSTLTLIAACGKSSSSEQGAPPPPTRDTPAATGGGGGGGDPVAKAKEIFATRCTPCHGATGKGDGAASASLQPPPRDFSDPAWQTSVDDAYIEKIIKFGGAAVGKAAAMPGNPDLTDPAVITELKNVVRGFGK
ncbi:MAG: cytochrome c [Kofleriaceae bacterium]|nr:cytochrome c [Kofleriaceae bacterium]MCL4228037.1 c-type cytochrome [Myxococcales bacterium]